MVLNALFRRIAIEKFYRETVSGGESGTVSLFFCVKIKFYREVCQSKLLAISVWRFIINIHDIRITTAVFTVQWFNDIR